MRREVLDRLLAARADKRPAALVTDPASGAQALVTGGAVHGDLALAPAELERVEAAIRADRSALDAESGRFVQVFNPPLRLVIVGAVHVAQALAPLAARVGYEVTVVDPRRAWATGERFPEVRLVTEWPDEALSALDLDHRAAVAALTHDPKIDDPALSVALRSEAFYIGALGSTRTHAKRLERLRANGFDEERLARIHGPIGLAIGARTPAEIAISILAQMTQVLRGAAPAPRVAAAAEAGR